jgi:hypothetical protein
MSRTMNPVFRRALLLAFGAALAGCTSAADLAARDNQRCADRGFVPNSDLYANCLLQLESERSARTEQRRRENLEKPFDPSTVTQGR